jgi:hypothetical protein
VISSGSGAAGFYSRLYLFDGVESSGVGGGGMKFFVLVKNVSRHRFAFVFHKLFMGGKFFFNLSFLGGGWQLPKLFIRVDLTFTTGCWGKWRSPANKNKTNFLFRFRFCIFYVL